MSPLPNTKVVPAGWSRHHAKAAQGGQNAQVRVHDPSRDTPGAFDPATGTRAAATPFWLTTAPVTARVQEIRSATQANLAQEAVAVRDYLIQLPMDHPAVQIGNVVVTTACVNDPSLLAVDLVVQDVQYGSERFTRDLVCRATLRTTP